METVIKNALDSAIMVERPYTPSGKPRLYPSEAGGCSRQTILRINGAKQKKYPIQAMWAMEDGKAYEDSSLKLLQQHFGTDNVIDQLALQNDYWSGKADFVINHKTENVVIVEHKATGQKWWDYQDKLPEKKHVIQLALYKQMYFDKFGFYPELRLFYRGWQSWAEFLIIPTETTILVEGKLTKDKKGVIERSLELPINLEAVVGKLQYHYSRNILPKRPAEDKQNECGCTFKGEKSCPFYDNCWPKEKTLDEILQQKA